MVFENGLKNIQAAAYNGARMVYMLPRTLCTHLCLCELFQTYWGMNMWNHKTNDLSLSLKNLVSEVKMNFH